MSPSTHPSRPTPTRLTCTPAGPAPLPGAGTWVRLRHWADALWRRGCIAAERYWNDHPINRYY